MNESKLRIIARLGSVNITARQEELFWKKVFKPENLSECWLWTSAMSRGYGCMGIGEQMPRTIRTAHRISKALSGVEVPDDIPVCHHCDNRRCVNPEHLYVGTAQTNVDDMMNRGRGNKPKGERNRSAKIKEQDVRNIRSRHASGESMKALAAEYGLYVTAIHKIIHFVNWKHVT